MIVAFAWTATISRHGGTELSLITAEPTDGRNRAASSLPGAPAAETRDRVRAALDNSGAGYPDEPFRLRRRGGSGDQPLHDLAVAVAIHVFATDPPWRGLLDNVVFHAELRLDGGLRPSRSPQAITAVLAAAARAEFGYVVVAPLDSTGDLDRIEGISVVTAANLAEVFEWLMSLTDAEPFPAPRPPESAGLRISYQLGPGRIRELRSVLDGFVRTIPSGTDGEDTPSTVHHEPRPGATGQEHGSTDEEGFDRDGGAISRRPLRPQR